MQSIKADFCVFGHLYINVIEKRLLLKCCFQNLKIEIPLKSSFAKISASFDKP